MERTLWALLVSGGLALILIGLAYFPFLVAVGTAVGVVVGLFATYGYVEWLRGLGRPLEQHLCSGQWRKGEVLDHEILASDWPNIQLALDHLRQISCPELPVLGAPFGNSIISLLVNNSAAVPIETQNLPRSLHETVLCAGNGLYRLKHQGQPYCALLARGQQDGAALSILAMRRETAHGAYAAILEAAKAQNVYRGAVVCVDPPQPIPFGSAPVIRFHELPAVERQQIILPEELMGVLDRNVPGFFASIESLRRAGQHTRHGVLLHGPPGVGKTLVTKYLARQCPKVSVILLTGKSLTLIRESCRLARLLAPSLVVLEDVDLIATERDSNRENPLLHDLMDEMDGLGKNADCVFLLTTNRPEVLEPALASRPGRVDQTIFFPLPDLECRRRLLTMMTASLDVTDVPLDGWLERTEGASPAFLQEFIRKVVVMALERGETAAPLRLRQEDFERAMRELVAFGGDLTRNLLGYRPSKVGFRSPGSP
jgi:hypothetical protein